MRWMEIASKSLMVGAIEGIARNVIWVLRGQASDMVWGINGSRCKSDDSGLNLS